MPPKRDLLVKMTRRSLLESAIRFMKHGRSWVAEAKNEDPALKTWLAWIVAWMIARQLYTIGDRRLFEKEGK